MRILTPDAWSLPFETGVAWTLAACALAAGLVFTVMIYSIATFRSPHEGGRFRRSAWLETLWALVPIVIIAGMATPALRSVATPAQAPPAIASAALSEPAG